MSRVWLASVLVALASRLVAGVQTTATEDEVEDEDDGLPMGHPVVVQSSEAKRMLYEGEAFAKAARAPEPGPLANSRGSLRDRIERARKNA